MVDAGADDDHRAALGPFRIMGELAGDADGMIGRHAGDCLLPGRRIGHIVVIARRASAAEPAVEPVVRAHQVEDARDEPLAIGQRQPAHRHVADEYVAALVVLGEALVRPAAEIGESHRSDLVTPVEGAQCQPNEHAALAIFFLEVPATLRLALLRPAIAHRTLRNHRRACLL